MRKILLLCFALLLGACTAGGPVGGSGQEQSPTLEQLTLKLGTLPGATIGAGDPPSISYPEQRLFSPAAVLPQVGSEALLDPLVELLRSYPGWHWEATVRAVSTNGGDYDQRLAVGRARLLERYFTARGLEPGRVHFVPLGEQGTPFELRPMPAQASPESSSGVKE